MFISHINTIKFILNKYYTTIHLISSIFVFFKLQSKNAKVIKYQRRPQISPQIELGLFYKIWKNILYLC